MSTLISVIISTYNQAQFIEETIKSILEQTYENFEVILVNNASTDNTKEIVDKYSGDKFKIYHNKYCGLSASRNFGASKSSGDFILFIDGDDKISPDFLEKTSKVLEENPEIGFAYTDTQHFSGSNGSWSHPEYNFQNLLQQNFISSCSLIRKSAYDQSGGYDTDNWGYWEDWQEWIKLGSIGWYGKHIPEKLFYYRVHAKSGMQSKRNSMLSLVYRAFVISKFPKLYDEVFVESSKNILSMYPDDFMKWTFAEQESYLEEI